MSSELESVNLPTELLDEARDAVRRGSVGNVADYVADALRLRLAKDRALAQVTTTLFGGPPPEDVLATVRQRAGLPPRRAAS
jgi:Arc/MetJ-type ribon-helix-helix transcriptional regulator